MPPLGRKIGLDSSDIVFDGKPALPSPIKGAEPPIFDPCLLCLLLAGWIKMPLGMEVGIDLVDIVLYGTQLPSPKREQSPQFLVHVYRG